MAESFRNFCAGMSVRSSSDLIVIPSGIGGSNEVTRSYPSGWNGSEVRDVNTCAQIHSIYVSMKSNNKIQGIERYNPANFVAFNLFITSTKDPDYKFYIVYDGRVCPGAPFFIEKNITLEPHQRLVLNCPSDSVDYDSTNNTTRTLNNVEGTYIEITASTVLLPTSN